MLVNGIKSIVQTAPKSLQYGAKGVSYGLMAHHTLTPNGLVMKHVLKPMGEFFGERLGFNALGKGIADVATTAWGGIASGAKAIGLSSEGWLGQVGTFFGENLGFSAAGQWIGKTFSEIMGKEAITTGFLAPFIGASTLTIGNVAAVGAAIPLIGLGVKYIRNVAAKRAAQAATQATAQAAANAAAQAGSRLSGRTLAIAGGGLAAGAAGTVALTAGPAMEAGQQISRIV